VPSGYATGTPLFLHCAGHFSEENGVLCTVIPYYAIKKSCKSRLFEDEN